MSGLMFTKLKEELKQRAEMKAKQEPEMKNSTKIMQKKAKIKTIIWKYRRSRVKLFDILKPFI